MVLSILLSVHLRPKYREALAIKNDIDCVLSIDGSTSDKITQILDVKKYSNL